MKESLRSTKLLIALLALPFATMGCVVDDDSPDYVRPAPKVIVREPSSPDVDVTVRTPPIEIKTQPPTKATTGY